MMPLHIFVSLLFLTAMFGCRGPSSDEEFRRCWNIDETADGEVIINADGVFLSRHGVLLVSYRCPAMLYPEGAVLYGAIDKLRPPESETELMPYNFRLSIRLQKSYKGVLAVEQVLAVKPLIGGHGARVLARYDALSSTRTSS